MPVPEKWMSLLLFSGREQLVSRIDLERRPHRLTLGRRPSRGPIINYGEGGGLQNRRGGGHVKCYPYKKIRGGGGCGKGFGIDLTWELEVLATPKGHAKTFHP